MARHSLVVLAVLLGAAAASPLRARAAPSVDLGYEVHTGTANATGAYYLFSNVPYAQQPVGARRFQPPELPTGANSAVNDGGSTGVQCMQAYPQWLVDLQAASYGASSAVMEQILWSAAGQTEACLVLDVYAPQAVFDSACTKAPVLLWIHGGGFTYGSKTSVGDPAGIMARSQLNGSKGVVFVSINYRLGLYGWLGGSGTDAAVTPNLGLYDQRAALAWVQQYIGRFGGDPARVTVMGESAGAASILHQLTAYGGASAAPAFQRAIIQSPAFQFSINTTDGYARTLAQASTASGVTVSSVAGLTALDASTLAAVNQQVVLGAGYGEFVYGVARDGTFVPALPQVLLAQGRFHRGVGVMASHTSREAVPFVPSTIATEAELAGNITALYPEASAATVDYMLNTLYPAADYAAPFYRAVRIATDANFACATRHVALALANQTHNYIFAYPPGYHAGDTPYMFYNGDQTTLDEGAPVNAPLAYALQDYLVGFAMTGNPDASPAGAAVSFPVYGGAASVLELGASGVVAATDDMANARCAWWQCAMVQGLV